MAPFQTPRRSGRGVSGRPRPQINMQAKAGKKNKVAEDVLITAPIQVDSIGMAVSGLFVFMSCRVAGVTSPLGGGCCM